MSNRDEMKAECVHAMGEDLGIFYWSLNEHATDLWLIWNQYKNLFSSDERTVQLLNESAPLLFSVVQGQFWDSVIMGISRLTDRPTVCGSNTLTIRSLPSKIQNAPELLAEVDKLCVEALANAGFVRDHRNKRIAHNDLNHSLDRTAHPLQKATRDKIEACLQSICAVLNKLSTHYRKTTVMYDKIVVNGGSGQLLSRLKKAAQVTS